MPDGSGEARHRCCKRTGKKELVRTNITMHNVRERVHRNRDRQTDIRTNERAHTRACTHTHTLNAHKHFVVHILSVCCV